MKLAIIAITFMMSVAVLADPPPGYPWQIEGTITSGSAVGFSGHIVIPWNDGMGGYNFNPETGQCELIIYATPSGDDLLCEVSILAGSTSWGPVEEDWTYGIVANGIPVELPADDPDYFLFVPTAVSYGVGLRLWQTLDYVWAGVGLALMLYFLCGVVGFLLRSIGILSTI